MVDSGGPMITHEQAELWNKWVPIVECEYTSKWHAFVGRLIDVQPYFNILAIFIDLCRRSVEALGWEWNVSALERGTNVRIRLLRDNDRYATFGPKTSLGEAWIAAVQWLAEHRRDEERPEITLLNTGDEIIPKNGFVCLAQSTVRLPSGTKLVVKGDE